MEKEYKEADKILKEVVNNLQAMTGNQGEDVSYWRHVAMDSYIKDLIKVKVLMALAEKKEEEKENEKFKKG